MGQTVAIIILFILIAGVAYAIHKHAHNKAVHAVSKPTTPAPVGSGSGGIAGAPPTEAK